MIAVEYRLQYLLSESSYCDAHQLLMRGYQQNRIVQYSYWDCYCLLSKQQRYAKGNAKGNIDIICERAEQTPKKEEQSQPLIDD